MAGPISCHLEDVRDDPQSEDGGHDEEGAKEQVFHITMLVLWNEPTVMCMAVVEAWEGGMGGSLHDKSEGEEDLTTVHEHPDEKDGRRQDSNGPHQQQLI